LGMRAAEGAVRLKMLRDATHRMAPMVGYLPRSAALASRDRDATKPWRGWYHTARWRSLRREVLARDECTCRMCGRLEHDTSRLVADHIVPHRGNEALFWDDQNLQCLCQTCHSGAKQREEQGL